jgi:hypothetical protein
MLINDLIQFLEALPRTVAVGWATWLFAGLLLTRWQSYESKRLVVHAVPVKQRPKSGVRPPSAMPPPPRPVVKSVPMSSGDAFGELEALLEQPNGTHRMPGDNALAAPQSLP